MPLNASRSRALIVSRPVLVTALVLGFALLFATALLTALSTRRLVAVDQRATKTQHALAAATQFTTALSDATTAARTTTAERQPVATSYRAARERARMELAMLATLFQTDATLNPIVLQLRQLTEDYLATLDRAVEASSMSDPSTALTALDRNDTQSATNEIRQLVAALQRNHFITLSQESAAAAERAETIQLFNFGLILLSVLFAIGLTLWLLRQVRDLEGLITVCAWTRRVQWDGRWVSFEEYLSERFNLYCSHGICEEAAEKMRQEAANTPIPADFGQ